MAPGAHAPIPAPFLPESVLLDLLAVSLTGVNVLRPVYNPAGEIEDFAIEYLNPTGQRMTGLAERPGGTLLTRFPHAIVAGILGYYRRVYQGRATGHHEVNYQADGLDNYFRLAARRSGDLLVVSFTDTGDQDRSAVEAALRQSQARVQAAHAAAEHQRNELLALVAQAPVAVAVYRGPQHRVSVANAATLAIWDRAWADVRDRPVFEALPEAANPAVVAFFDQVFTTGTPYHAHELPTTIVRRGQPETVYWNVVMQPDRQPDGRIRGIVWVGTDVSEQVRARQQVEQREASFRTMADAAPAMLWVTDPDGQCTYLNAQWYRFTGQTEAEALGLGWTDAVHPEDAATAGRLFLDANARRVPFDCRYRLRRRDGVYRWATDTGWPRFTDAGEYAGIVGTVIDIHEQHLAEEELQATNAHLTRTNVDLDNFIYTASHDLRVPIVNIEGLLLALGRELPPAGRVGSVPTLLQFMQDSVNRFKRTIEQLTDVSKLQQEYDQPTTQVRVAAVVEEVRLDLLPLIEHAQARLDVDVPADAHVPFSEKNLRSVVYNLLSNALKYRHPDRAPRVQLTYQRQDQRHVLRVQDNGLGFDVATAEAKLFGLFQRLHAHVEGTGIGLYMVKKMVENSGGRIEVASQVGEGTTFTVSIPVTPAS